MEWGAWRSSRRRRHLVNRNLSVFALVAAGCGAARKDLGEVQVKTLRPMTSTQRFDYVNFHVQDGRLFVSSPNVPTDFDLVAEDDGCLRGSSGIRQLHYCPVSLRPDADGTWHWRSVNAALTALPPRLKHEGRVLAPGAGA